MSSLYIINKCSLCAIIIYRVRLFLLNAKENSTMSFVICAADINSAIIITDGRCVDPNDSTIIINEFYKKNLKYNNKVIIGFAGSTFGELVVKHIIQLGHDRKMTEYLTVEDISFNMCDFLKRNVPNAIKSNFVVAGRNENNKMEIDVFGTRTNFMIKKYIPTDTESKLVTLSPDGIDGNKIVNTQLEIHKESFKDGLLSAICEVAKMDNTVNTNCFVETIS